MRCIRKSYDGGPNVFLYYITDRKQLSDDRPENIRLLLERIRLASEAGVDAIQLREKDLTARELVELASHAKEIVDQANVISAAKVQTRLLINSRVDVALACGCDGVHLRSDDISPADTRAVIVEAGATRPFVAVSCHSVSEVALAAGHGADFVVLGPIFGKSGSDGPALGLPKLKEASRQSQFGQSELPIIALGGITLENARQCLQAGAAGIAGIRLFQTGNIASTISQLRAVGSQPPMA